MTGAEDLNQHLRVTGSPTNARTWAAAWISSRWTLATTASTTAAPVSLPAAPRREEGAFREPVGKESRRPPRGFGVPSRKGPERGESRIPARSLLLGPAALRAWVAVGRPLAKASGATPTTPLQLPVLPSPPCGNPAHPRAAEAARPLRRASSASAPSFRARPHLPGRRPGKPEEAGPAPRSSACAADSRCPFRRRWG